MKILLLMLTALAAFAQPGYRLSQKNPDVPYQYVFGYSGTSLIYLCRANSQQPVVSSVSIASATQANPVVITVSGGHGFDASSTPLVVISGGTGNWVGVNGTFTATIASSTTFSIPVNSTSFGAVAGSLIYTTRAPLTTNPVWSVQKFIYNGGGSMIWSGWSGGTTAYNQVCTGNPSQAQ